MASRIRTFRIEDELYERAALAAQAEGISVAQFIRDAIDRSLEAVA
jgi:predicted HicB family RNase H-like nuclease